MSDESNLPKVPESKATPEWESALKLFREIIEPLADADKRRSDNETQRYDRHLQSWDQEARRGHGRFLMVAGMTFLTFFLLLAFAFYAYATGSPALATHVITGIFSALAGFLAGFGFRRSR
jgi:hypothetical protein